MVYTVSEIAKLMGVPPSTIRYYDKEGLLPFIERSEGGIRLFKESDYQCLQIIECLKQTGMSLKEIKQFIYMVIQGDDTIEGRLELFKKQREVVLKQLEELNKTLETIDFKCWYYETAQKAGTTSVFDDMTYDDVPEKFRELSRKLLNLK